MKAKNYTNGGQGPKAALGAVTTVPEIEAIWGITRKSILMRIYKGDIEARKSGNTWLCSVVSVVRLWGVPANLGAITDGE